MKILGVVLTYDLLYVASFFCKSWLTVGELCLFFYIASFRLILLTVGDRYLGNQFLLSGPVDLTWTLDLFLWISVDLDIYLSYYLFSLSSYFFTYISMKEVANVVIWLVSKLSMNSLNTFIKKSILFWVLLIKSTLTSLYLEVVLVPSLYLYVLSKASPNLL